MKFSLSSNPTSVILTVFIQDSSATDGSGVSGLLHTSGITGGYVQRDGTGVALTVDEDVTTEGTYQAPSAAGKVRIGTPANMPSGFYELHFHNDVFASADWVTIGLEGATNMAVLPIEVQMGANSASVLTGVNTVTITVDDGTGLLENAKVRVTEGANTEVKETNASGQVTFSLDDATWTVAITKPGYSFASTTLVVDGNETQTYSMTQVVSATAAPGQVTGFLTCYDENGLVEENASVSLQFANPGTLTIGFGFDESVRTETSDENGIVQFSGLFKGAKYRIQRGNSEAEDVTIPESATDPYELVSVVGVDA